MLLQLKQNEGGNNEFHEGYKRVLAEEVCSTREPPLTCFWTGRGEPVARSKIVLSKTVLCCHPAKRKYYFLFRLNHGRMQNLT